jgi:hypothetical protein
MHSWIGRETLEVILELYLKWAKMVELMLPVFTTKKIKIVIEVIVGRNFGR